MKNLPYMKNDAEINLHQYPFQWAVTNVQTLKIYEATKMPGTVNCPVGTVVTDGKSELKIAAADGFLAVKSLQIAGKKRMNVKDFLCGFKATEECYCE